MATQHCGKTRIHSRHTWTSTSWQGLRRVTDRWSCPGTHALGTPRHRR